MITIEKFGKDHWSLIAYIETCANDGDESNLAKLDKQRLRCNPARHPLLNVNQTQWKESYGTRVRVGFEDVKNLSPQELIARGFILPEHDDWDCLDDLEAAGLIEVISLTQSLVRITPFGISVAHSIRRHKLNNGQYHNYQLQKN